MLMSISYIKVDKSIQSIYKTLTIKIKNNKTVL